MLPSDTLSPLADFDRPVPFKVPKAGRVGNIAAASSRRGQYVAPKKLEAAPEARGLHPAIGLVGILALWGLLVGFRAQIVRVAPATAPAYSALGLKVNLRQMDISGVSSKLIEEEGRKILVVEGEIRNLAEAPRAAPRMRLAVLDDQGRELYNWTAAPPKSRLSSGEKAFFRARLAAPPMDGHDVRVRFAPETAGKDT